MFFEKTPMILAASLLAAAACSSQTSTTTTAATEEAHGAGDYAKPGPALEMSHSYDGQSDSFSSENFTVTVTDGYEDGTLTVIIDAPEALNFFSTQEFTFDMSGDAPHTMPVDFSAREDGRYYLNVIMHADLGNDEVQSTVASIAVPVGTGEAVAFTPEHETTLTPDGETVIEMEAEETISTGE